ncbi:hypothetical protein ACFYKX_05260 [Cytobacillus sp. FJAT-54145]|uniref:Uncharacterized protein n=1 Tax=Cytobacillus spartinae TaxID=3299023 RepID=A0ABW6K768_9BACI
MLEILFDLMNLPSVYTLYASILWSIFFVYYFQVETRQKFIEDHLPFDLVTDKINPLETTLKIRVNPVISRLFKALKKYQFPNNDDEGAISSL